MFPCQVINAQKKGDSRYAVREKEAVELVPVVVELVQQPVVEVDEPVLLVEVPVLVVMVVVVVKVHWRFQNFLVNPELSWP